MDQCLLQRSDGFNVRIAACYLLRKESQILNRFGGILSAGVMISEPIIDISQSDPI